MTLFSKVSAREKPFMKLYEKSKLSSRWGGSFRKLMPLFLFGCFLILSPRAEAQNFTSAPAGRIFGPNDLITVDSVGANIPNRFRTLLDAFGRIDPMGCTATHLGKGLVLTAGHCFEATPELEKELDCDDIEVEWGYRNTSGGKFIGRCTSVIAMQTDDSKGIDYAVFRVDRFPREHVKVDFSHPVSLGDSVTIFSHPERAPLQWSNLCKVIPMDQSFVSSDFMFHRCDTEGGSSGAAILNALTGKLVAIHGGGLEDPNGFNYGTKLVNTMIFAILNGFFD
jgi:V8-like Glu-specific endopeptidase